jgi:protein SCO1
VNQAGTSMRLYSDLIKGRTVVIIPFFTTCTGACPVMNQNLSAIQDWLGHRLGQDAFILSISVDPSSDTVPVLREYARQFNARPGWYFLGGRRENVELALAKLGQSVGAREDHQTIMIIGNEKTGLWKKAFGLADSASLIHIVDGVLNDKGESGK